MAGIRILFRSTAVRLSTLFILLFAVCAVFLVVYVTYLSERLLNQQTEDAIKVEMTEVRRFYDRTGIAPLMRVLERRARQPGAGLYIVTAPNGEFLGGNVSAVQPGVLDVEGWSDEPFHYSRDADDKGMHHSAVAEVFVLDNGMRILVGRDLAEPSRMRDMVRNAVMIALAIMGVGAIIIWFAIGRNALRRLDRISEATTKIMAGDLSQRLPETNSGDEFDRLSSQLNAMLGRIEKLNEGLRQVSDNIAHDLKTPLTRLRNKASNAMLLNDVDAQRDAFETIISESDQLIRTFNALLMISRVEAGSMAAEMTAIDISAIVADACELYEPVAEDEDIVLTSSIEQGLKVLGNRELIGQSLSNLIDNALKYAPKEGVSGKIMIGLKATNNEIILSVSDNGSGVPSTKREDVTKRFVRLDESRNKPGTGLGLSMVSAIVGLHGGSMKLSDTDSNNIASPGLTVSLILPRLA